MTVQDLFIPSREDVALSGSSSVAVLVGAILAVLLIWLVQGTDLPFAAPEWHGNVSSSVAIVHQQAQ